MNNLKNGKIRPFLRTIIIGLLILMLLTALYSLVVESTTKKEEISLSQLVLEINADKVSKIVVKGDNLEITFKDNSQKAAKKEAETALSQTLSNYGVSKDALNGVAIDIQDPSSFLYWIGNLLPFLIPLLIKIGSASCRERV